MSNVFTFIRSGAFTKCANVYQGSFSSSSEVEGMQPTYEITIRGHELGVTSAASGEKPIITGRLEGLTKRRGKVYGSHAIAVIEKTTAFRQGWTIHDFDGNEYKWKVGSFSKCSWELYDMNKKIVATFDRTKSSTLQ
ncbi:hypothetical protein DL89DRAFT_294051 [Linderina pennispora]|uniref:Uncharacterized protein n=1 Tax=Linderina pennispora TaxID=61395 RepID=A0A1Y1W3Q8_9FUNG|nr:uncharacterized protein DL89DRAFT_294051 [Linderina pennispora]ORX68107.1 hypothetical protein DL89DRAFT_294051 [Linderina pennispora]